MSHGIDLYALVFLRRHAGHHFQNALADPVPIILTSRDELRLRVS